METVVYLNGKRFNKSKFKQEEVLENLVQENYKLLFGNKTVFIQKSKIKTESLGGSIPDGFLLDLRDVNNPQIYFIEVELAEHDFYKQIFPQVTRFIAFFNSSENRKKLIDKLFVSITANNNLEKDFSSLLGSKEIFKTLTDAVENSQNILLLLDEDKPEIYEAKKAYAEWDKLVRVEILNLYKKDKDTILTLTPPFEEVDISDTSRVEVADRYDENYHLESTDEEVKTIYQNIKERMLIFNKNLSFNPQHYYISIVKNKNFAYIKLTRKKVHIVIMLPYKESHKLIKKHKITKLSQAIQDFYGGPCFRVTIERNKNLSEIVSLLKATAKKSK